MQQTALSCFPVKHCGHTLFQSQVRPLQRPLPSRSTRKLRIQSLTAASQVLPFLLHFLVAMETHVIYVQYVALETEEHPWRRWETRPCHFQPHSRVLPVNGRGESRGRPAPGLSLNLGPCASAPVTQGTGGHLTLLAPRGRR